MANTLLVKRSAVSGNVPSTSALALGELAVNTYDGKLFFKKNDGAESLVEVSNEGHTHTSVDTTDFEIAVDTAVGSIVGDVLPATDDTGVVGSTTKTWNNGQFSNLTINGTLVVRAAIDLADSDIIRLGSSDDWKFYYNGSTNKAQCEMEASCNGIQFTNNGTEVAYLERTTGNLALAGKLTVAGDPNAVVGREVPISASIFTVPANTSLVAVDELDITDTLIIEGNLAII
jgi:hypothetical protein